MNALITGGRGFIGSALIRSWQARADIEHIYALSRYPDKLSGLKGQGSKLKPLASLDDLPDSAAIDIIVNLAGEPILDKRWSATRKKQLYDSRLATTETVLKLIARLDTKPGLLISGSAVGFYGNQLDSLPLTEIAEGRSCFAHKLCHDWEQKALSAENLGVRVCLVRTGIVLGQGGALKRMLLPFKFGLGGPIASGQQWMSWIDLDDEVAAINFLIDHQTLAGVFNLTAPNPVTNSVFAKTLAAELGRPAFLRTPAIVLQLLLGEGAELLVEGQRVVPTNLLEAGFEFQYPTLAKSLKHWL